MTTEFSGPNERDIGEILFKPEFRTIFPRRSLKDALGPISQATGVDFFNLYQRRYDINPHQDAKDLDTGQPVKKELPRDNLEEIEDLKHYFQPASGRTYFRYIDRYYRPDKAETELGDYLIMEEEIAHGHKVFAIFEYPGKGKDYWRQLKIPEGDEVIKRKFKYLKLRFAAVIPVSQEKSSYGSQDEAIDLIATLLTSKNSQVQAVGLLSSQQEDPTSEKYDSAITLQTYLAKDADTENVGLLATAEGARTLTYADKWLVLAMGGFVSSVNPNKFLALLKDQATRDLLIQITGTFKDPQSLKV